MKKIILTSLLIGLTGCAGAVRGTTEQVQINSNPAGAHIEISNGETCTAPCAVELPRKSAAIIKASKQGCQDASVQLTPQVDATGFMLSGAFDYSSGAAYTLVPNPVNLSLSCSNN